MGTIRVAGQERRLNLKRDRRDERDFLRVPRAVVIPPRASVRAGMPEVWDQGQLGCCTGEGWAAMVAFALGRQGVTALGTPSVLFIYFNELEAENNLPNDVGSSVRNGGMVLVKKGVCSEKTWPFEPERFAQRPPLNAYAQAALFQAVRIERIPDLTGVRQHLAEGWPVVFGTDLYPSFQSIQRDGIMPMPTEAELANDPAGAHCMVAVGYDNEDPRHPISVRNSWGKDFGDAGYVHIPGAYLERNAGDYWSLELMETGAVTPCGQSWWQRLFGWL
jgi:hypothetical protein